MTYRFRIKRGARADAREAREWYEREAPHVVDAFRNELSAVFGVIAEHPLMYRQVRGEVRRALLSHFPYAVLFAIERRER